MTERNWAYTRVIWAMSSALVVVVIAGTTGIILLDELTGLPRWAPWLIGFAGLYAGFILIVLTHYQHFSRSNRRHAYALLIQRLIDVRVLLDDPDVLKSNKLRSALLWSIERGSRRLADIGHLHIEGSRDAEFKDVAMLQFRSYAASLSKLRKNVVAPEAGTREQLVKEFESTIAAVVDQQYGDLPSSEPGVAQVRLSTRIRKIVGVIMASILLIGGGLFILGGEVAFNVDFPNGLAALGVIFLTAGLIPFFQLLGIDLGQLLRTARDIATE